MDDYEIEQYMKSKEKFSIPEIQEKFHLKYGDVRRYFYGLQETKEIILKEGLFYYNFDVEVMLDLYRTMLWECIKDQKYNKHILKSEYRLDPQDVSGFEDWLRNHGYYDFVYGEVLISRDDFIKRFGKREEPTKEEDKEDRQLSFQDFIKEIEDMKLNTNDSEEDETDIESPEEDDEEELEDFDVDDEETESKDDSPLKTCDTMLRELLEGNSIKTKEDFLSLAEKRLTIEENEMPIFHDFLEAVIEEVKDITEVEFKSYLVRLLKD